MLPQKLDTTLAHKGINLMPNLTGTEKRVAAAIIDHFNRNTGRCDPSLDRIAGLLGIDRRTVIRSIKAICATGILQKVRHGGYSQRNSYRPNWALFREMDTAWNEQFRSYSKQRAYLSESSERCKNGHRSGGNLITQTGGNLVTQTTLTNQSNKTSSKKEVLAVGQPSDVRVNQNNQSSETIGKVAAGLLFPSTNRMAPCNARTAAQRRWMNALHDQFARDSKMYGKVLDVLSNEVQEGATSAEMRRRNAGIAFVLDYLSRISGNSSDSTG